MLKILRNIFAKNETRLNNLTTALSTPKSRGVSNKSLLSYQNIKPNFELLGQTVNERFDLMLAKCPDHVAFKFSLTQTSYSFRELKQRIDQIAQHYLDLGFRKGDRLALMLPNMPELVLNIFAAASIGVIVVIMNPAYQFAEIEYMLKKTNAKGVVILDNFKILRHYDILARLAPELTTASKGELKSSQLPDLKHVILVNNQLVNDKSCDYKGTWSFTNDFQKFNKPFKPLPYVDLEDTLALLFTVILFSFRQQ
jgi:acyl-CoA synthetase (AMP-forming)/AMP-acid ligase II